jgi:hypothetical protein
MEPDVEIHERMARIEVQLTSHIDDEEEQMQSMDRKLDRIELELSRYRGFVGGIMFIATAVVAFFKFFWQDMVNFFK